LRNKSKLVKYDREKIVSNNNTLLVENIEREMERGVRRTGLEGKELPCYA